MKIVEFKDYDNQTTPLSAYNLNRLQQNLITTKYQMTFSSAVSGGSTITLPCYYQVGQDTLDVYLNSELLKKASTKDSEGHYYEVGNSDTKSNQIKITSDWSIASGDVLNLIVRGTTDSYDQNLSPDKATQLADEISANKEEITALQTENSRLIRPKIANQQKVIDQLPQVEGQGTSITLKNTIEAQFTKFEIEGNSTQDGTPSPDNEVPILSAGDNGSINEKIKNADGTEEQDYSIPVQQPMRSIGDVRDLFFKNTVDCPYYDSTLALNGWYERHYSTEIVVPSSKWRLEISGRFSITKSSLGISLKVPLTNNSILKNKCTHYIEETPGRTWNKNQGFSVDRAGNITIYDTTYSSNNDLDGFQNFLSNNDVRIVALLENPTDLPCTETQIQQLENIPSTYKDFTIIQSQDETPAYLEVSGIYDLNNLINN